MNNAHFTFVRVFNGCVQMEPHNLNFISPALIKHILSELISWVFLMFSFLLEQRYKIQGNVLLNFTKRTGGIIGW